MKYCTKEWYQTMQKTDFHLLLKVSKKAEVFSEEYYKELYAKRETEQLRMDEEVSKVKFEEICSEEEFVSHEEFENARKDYEKNSLKFDPEETKKNFRTAQDYNIELLKTSLPEEILAKVADIRVLALDVCTAEVKRLITKFCKNNEKTVELTMKKLTKAEQEQFGENPPEFTDESFHDCQITALEKSGKDIVIKLDNSGGFTDCKGIVFKNAEIIEQDGDLSGAWWLYDEIYKTDNGFEIHALLENDELMYLTFICEKTEFIR